jgi:hypothetical protein
MYIGLRGTHVKWYENGELHISAKINFCANMSMIFKIKVQIVYI